MLSRRMTRIPTGPQILVEPIQGSHVLVGNFKIENIGVFANARSVRRFWDHHQLMLDRPADQDLRRRLGIGTARNAREKGKFFPFTGV